MAFIVEKDWVTKAGLRAVAIVVKYGERLKHRCGYVGLPKEHPLHGVSYSQQADCLTREMVENVKIGKKSPTSLAISGAAFFPATPFLTANARSAAHSSM